MQRECVYANIYMQSNRCNNIMCRKTQMHRSMKHKCKETHNKIYNNACKCVCALILFKNQGQVIYLLKLLKSPWEDRKLAKDTVLSYPIHTNPNVVCHEISQSKVRHLQSPPLAIS